MNTLLNLPGFAPSPDFLPALADAAIKGVVLLMLAAGLTLALRKSSAAARHLVWCSALVGLLLLPVFSIVLPTWRVPWLPDWRPDLPRGTVTFAPVEQTAAPSVPSIPTQSPISTITENIPVEDAEVSASQPAPEVPPINFATLLVLWSGVIWLAGAILALAPLLIGCGQILLLTKRCEPINEPAWRELLTKSSTELGLRRPVRMLRGENVNLPLTWGAWRPVLLLPTSAEAWTPERRRVVLLHELAHIKRWDWLTQMLAYLACALYWFNPLAWVAARRMRIEREQACDDLVLRSGSRASDYAEELLQLASGLGGKSLINWASVPMARRSTLEERLRAILDGQRNHAALTRSAVLGALALLTAIIVPIAMLRAAEPQSPTASSAPASDIEGNITTSPANKITSAESTTAVKDKHLPVGVNIGMGMIQAATVVGDVKFKTVDRTTQVGTISDAGTTTSESTIIIPGKEKPLQQGDMVIPWRGSSIVTGPNSHTQLIFSNGATVNVTAETELKIIDSEESQLGPYARPGTFMSRKKELSKSTVELELVHGHITGEVKAFDTNLGSTFTIKTSAGIQNVTGGTFDIAADSNAADTAAPVALPAPTPTMALPVSSAAVAVLRENADSAAAWAAQMALAATSQDQTPSAPTAPATANSANNDNTSNPAPTTESPLIETKTEFMDIPPGVEFDLAHLEVDKLKKTAGVEVLEMPFFTGISGKHARLKAEEEFPAHQKIALNVDIEIAPKIDDDAIHYFFDAIISQRSDDGVEIPRGGVAVLDLTKRDVNGEGTTDPGKPVVLDLGMMPQQLSKSSTPDGALYQPASPTDKMRHLVAIVTFEVLPPGGTATAGAYPSPTVIIPAAAGAKNVNTSASPATAAPILADNSVSNAPPKVSQTATLGASRPPLFGFRFIGYSVEGNVTWVTLQDSATQTTYRIKVGEKTTIGNSPDSERTIIATDFVNKGDHSTVNIAVDGNPPEPFVLNSIDLRPRPTATVRNNNASSAPALVAASPTPDIPLAKVNYADTDIKKILREVADLYNLNIVIPETLSGKTSIKLQNVSWETVYRVVLDPLGYTFVMDENIIKIVKKDIQSTEQLQTKVVPVKNASAEELAKTLAHLIDPKAGESITADPRTNMLIITARSEPMGDLQQSISRLDTAPSQKPPPPPGSGAPDQPAKLDLINYPDTDIDKILREVADLYKLKVVIPDGLSGVTSLKLHNVTWQQVFKVVLEPIGYTFVQDGDTVTIKKKDELAGESIQTKIEGIQYTQTTTGMTRVLVSVKPAQVDELTKALSAVLDTQSNPAESIVPDPANKLQLMITIRPGHLSNVRQILSSFGADTSAFVASDVMTPAATSTLATATAATHSPTTTDTPTLPPGEIQAAIVQGDVQLKAADGTMTPLARGDTFHLEDGALVVTPSKLPRTPYRVEGGTIVTGANGNTLLVFSNGTTMKVTANSELKISQFKQAPFDPAATGGTFLRLTKDPSKSITEVELNRGNIEGEVKPLDTDAGSTFTIKTATGIHNISGKFQVDANGDVMPKFSISGEVNKPGLFSFPADGNITVAQAIQNAGGFTDVAIKDKVSLVRFDKDGKRREQNVDMEAVLKGEKDKDVKLLPDDRIVVNMSHFAELMLHAGALGPQSPLHLAIVQPKPTLAPPAQPRTPKSAIPPLSPTADPQADLNALLQKMAQLARVGGMTAATMAYNPPDELAKMTPQMLQSMQNYLAKRRVPSPDNQQLNNDEAQSLEVLIGQTPTFNAAGDEATYMSTLYSSNERYKNKPIVFVKINGKWYAK